MTPVEALLLGLLIGAGITLVTRGLHAGEIARRDAIWLAEIFDSILSEHRSRTGSVEVEDDVVEAETVSEPASLPMDPDNPPFPRAYRRREGRPAKFCHCHGRELQDGEVVLFWPNPDIEGAFWLVCAPEGTTA